MILYLCRLLFLLLFVLAGTLVAQDTFIRERFVLPTDSTTPYPLNNLSHYSPKLLKVALVLSGGGARGFTHLGVLKALEENHIPIDLIVGSSIGSVVGGFYAAGYNADDLIELLKEIDWENLFSDQTNRTNLFWSQKSTPRQHFLELRFDRGIPYIPPALSPGQKIFDIIYSRLLYANFQSANEFDNLKIPFRAVATDLISGKKIVLSRGDLAEAISASMAVPLLFAPVQLDSMWLADGGIRDNLPVDVALENKADLIIAVDVSSPLRSAKQIKSPWQLADQVTTIMMQSPTLASQSKSDILIAPSLGRHGAGDFSKIDSLIDIGYQNTLQKIDSIKNLISIYQENLWGENIFLGEISTIAIPHTESSELTELLENFYHREGSFLYSYDLYRDLAELYESGLVSHAEIILQGTTSALELEYRVTENVIGKNIIFEINSGRNDTLSWHSGKQNSDAPLNFHALFAEINARLNGCFEKGQSLARVIGISYEPKSQDIRVQIDEGFIKGFRFEGNHITKDAIISRELVLAEGQVFEAQQAIASIQNIYATGLFDRVTLNVIRGDSANIILIRVKEKKYFLTRLGINASLERSAKAFLEIAEDNLFGREIKLSLLGLIGNLERRAEFKIYSVRLFRTLLTYRFSLYYHDRWDRYYDDFTQMDDYVTIRRGLNFVMGQQIARLGSITGEFRWDNVSVFPEGMSFPYGDNYRIRSLAIRSVVDKRDKLPFPERGIYNRWFWETGNKSILGGSTSFTRFYIALEGYYPFFHSFVYRIKGRGGSGDVTVPFSEFYSMGGIDDFPGLYERERLGRQILSLTNELRYKFTWDLPVEMYLGGSFNVGSTWESAEDPIKPSDFITSWGVYLALNSIIGPIKLSYGHLSRVRDLIYFSIGYEF
ncbi:MAG: patatin-like phospholipase family protein [bacterium]|nr:MAG: patatin-like phospholipase family protein [bacterium]